MININPTCGTPCLIGASVLMLPHTEAFQPEYNFSDSLLDHPGLAYY